MRRSEEKTEVVAEGKEFGGEEIARRDLRMEEEGDEDCEVVFDCTKNESWPPCLRE